jgi:hypothetical protein
MMNNQEKDLRRRLAQCQRLWIESESRHTKTKAQLMMAQAEILRLEFGVDIVKDEPELYEKIERLAGE